VQNKLTEKMDALLRKRDELLVQLEVLSEDWLGEQETRIVLSEDVELLRAENRRLLEKMRAARKMLDKLNEGKSRKQAPSSPKRKRTKRRRSG
jgi:hypothetical protein